MELESDRIGNDANCISGLPCGNSCQPVSNSCTTSLLPETEAIADYITNPDNFKDYEQTAIAPRITLETIINPVFTDNGKRSDRATKLQDYTITEGSITGQFVGTHSSNDVLFDFKLVKGGDRWNLTYKYADGQLEPIDSILVSKSKNEFDRLKENDAKNCKKGVACGNSCIAQSKKCKQNLGAKAAAVADHISDPANLEKGAESSEASGGIETAKDAIAQGERIFSKDDIAAYDKARNEAQSLKEQAIAAKSTDPQKYMELATQYNEKQAQANKMFEDNIYSKVVGGSTNESKALAEKVEIIKIGTAKQLNDDDIRKNVSDFFAISNGKGSESMQKISVQEGVRGSANEKFNSVSLPTGDTQRYAAFHEIGHHIEFENPKYAELSRDFIMSRSTSDEPQSIREMTGNPAYRADEMAYPDKFYDPYVGKVGANGNTEVIATATGELSSAKTARQLFNKDREHFMFTVGVLKD